MSINHFNLFDQIGVDMMHDILEGVAKYVMVVVLIHYIQDVNMFSIEMLNQKIQGFSYGPDERNAPCTLAWEHINQGNIRLSASEMLTLIRYFSLLCVTASLLLGKSHFGSYM